MNNTERPSRRPRSPQRRWATIFFAIVGVATIAAVASLFIPINAGAIAEHSSVTSTPETVAKSAIPVRVICAGEVPPPVTYARYRGTVQSRRESRLGFRRGGRVLHVAVDEGDQVRVGDVLADLDVADLNARRAQAIAELDASRASFDEAQAGPRQQTIDAASADVDRLTAELQSARADLDRETQLRRRGAGTLRGYDNARFAVDRITASLESARSRLDELQEGTRQEQIAAAKAAVAVAQAALARVDVDLADSRIIAPYDGQIASRMIDEGTIVGPDAIALQLIESPPLEARFGLPESVAQTIRTDDLVTVETTTVPLEANVIRVHPTLDLATRTRSIDVQFSVNADLVPGQMVTLPIAAGTRHLDASEVRFWVPTASLIRGARGLWSLLVAVPFSEKTQSDLDGDGAQLASVQRRDVRVLQTTGDFSEVTGMVQHGDPIVSTGTHRIGPGVTVMAIKDSRFVDHSAVAGATSDP